MEVCGWEMQWNQWWTEKSGNAHSTNSWIDVRGKNQENMVCAHKSRWVLKILSSINVKHRWSGDLTSVVSENGLYTPSNACIWWIMIIMGPVDGMGYPGFQTNPSAFVTGCFCSGVKLEGTKYRSCGLWIGKVGCAGQQKRKKYDKSSSPLNILNKNCIWYGIVTVLQVSSITYMHSYLYQSIRHLSQLCNIFTSAGWFCGSLAPIRTSGCFSSAAAG